MTGRIAEHVAGIVGAGHAVGGRAATARLWGVALVGMVRAAADAWLADGGADSGRSADDLANALTTLAWDGLGAPHATDLTRLAAAHPHRRHFGVTPKRRHSRGWQAVPCRHFHVTPKC